MRLYKIRPSDVEAIAASPSHAQIDAKGNSRRSGLASDGRAIIVIVAGDDRDFVITTFPDD